MSRMGPKYEKIKKEDKGKSWKEIFLEQNSFLCDVDKKFIEDDFNLTSIRNKYSEEKKDSYFEMLLDFLKNNDKIKKSKRRIISDDELVRFYSLVHASFILSEPGLKKMEEKYKNKKFGVCPRFYCENEPVLPYGSKTDCANQPLLLYCPKCRRLYRPDFNNTDDGKDLNGSFFGPNYIHLLIPKLNIKYEEPKRFVRKCHGFAVNDGFL